MDDLDQNIASLNAGQKILEREIELVHILFRDTDNLLRGDPGRETIGIVARIESIENGLARLNAVIFTDSTGKKGLLHEVEVLSKGEMTLGERWKFATAVVVAIISLLGLLLTNWGHVIGFLGRG